MNKYAKVHYDSWQCRKSIKVGVGFIIIGLMFFAVPLRSLSAGTISVPGNSGSDSNGNWVEYNVSNNTKTNYTRYPDPSSTAIGISFKVGNGNSLGSFQSGFVGSGVYDNKYFMVTIEESSADVTENDVLGDYKDLELIKIYFGNESASPSNLEAVAGIINADKEGFIEDAGISELPYDGINMWLIILGMLLVIGGALAVTLPKYRKRASHQIS